MRMLWLGKSTTTPATGADGPSFACPTLLTMKHRSLCLLALAGVLAVAPLASAHSVWLESTTGHQVVIRFAEPGEVFEKSPGLLDELAQPYAWKAGADGKSVAFAVEKRADHFAVIGAVPTEAVFAESGWPVFRSEKVPAGAKTAYYLRWVPAAALASTGQAAFALDLVPTGEPGVFRLQFRGQPLADQKVQIVVPDEKETEIVSDSAGLVRVPAGKPGQYLLGASHREPDAAGFSFGQSYGRVGHNITVAWQQP